MKPLVYLFACTVTSLSLFTAHANFPDTQTHPYKQAINTLQQKNILTGYPNGNFKPENQINRAEFTKIAMETLSTQRERQYCRFSKTFSDVSAQDWFAPHVCVAVKKGIINGYEDGSFRPQNPIKFIEAAKIMAYALDTNIANKKNWYDGSVQYLSDKKAIPTSIGSLKKPITRGEMAEIIWRLKSGVHRKDSKKFFQNRLLNDHALKTKNIKTDHQQRRAHMKACRKRNAQEPLSVCLNRFAKK